MKNYKKALKWIKDNQNKPVNITIHASAIGYYTTWENGFNLVNNDITIQDNTTGQEIQILYVGEDFENIITNGELMSSSPDGDLEIETESATIGFKLL